MKTKTNKQTRKMTPDSDGLLPEYDFSRAVRNPFAGRITKPITVMFLTDEESRARVALLKKKKPASAANGRARTPKRRSR